MNIQDIIAAFFLCVGGFFMFVSALGIIRMPDTFMRMSASTKSATLGVGFMMLAAAIYYNEVGIASRLLATIIFVFLTAPVAAHMIGRAAYIRKTELWKNTIVDDLKGRYDSSTRQLRSSDEQPAPEAGD